MANTSWRQYFRDDSFFVALTLADVWNALFPGAAPPATTLIPVANLASAVKLQFNARDMTLASGNVAYAGVGFKPSLVLLFGIISTNQSATFGADDGINPRAYEHFQPGNIWQTTGGASMYFTTDNVNVQQAKILSFDADGYTLAWTKIGAPAAGNAFFSTVAFK